MRPMWGRKWSRSCRASSGARDELAAGDGLRGELVDELLQAHEAAARASLGTCGAAPRSVPRPTIAPRLLPTFHSGASSSASVLRPRRVPRGSPSARRRSRTAGCSSATPELPAVGPQPQVERRRGASPQRRRAGFPRPRVIGRRRGRVVALAVGRPERPPRGAVQKTSRQWYKRDATAPRRRAMPGRRAAGVRWAPSGSAAHLTVAWWQFVVPARASRPRRALVARAARDEFCASTS